MVHVTAEKHGDKPLRAFFIDSENGAERLLEGMDLLNRSDVVVVFHRGSFPAGLTNQLELGNFAVEWIECVDPGVKNSMDVQIIAELSMRLAEGGFGSAFIVSEDKGYMPAVHYLQRTAKGSGCEIALVKNIAYAVTRAVLSALTEFKHARTTEDVERALAPLYGEEEAHSLAGKLTKVLVRSARDADGEKADAAAAAPDAAMRSGESEAATLGVQAETDSFMDLPGIGRALAGKLEDAGIVSPDELARIGSVEAWGRIFLRDKSFPPKWVYSFEAAIRGVPVNSMDSKMKKRLNNEIKKFMVSDMRAVS